ncbi:hypothetical protein GCM10009603_19320 [Nocardiopsis exhalans]
MAAETLGVMGEQGFQWGRHGAPSARGGVPPEGRGGTVKIPKVLLSSQAPPGRGGRGIAAVRELRDTDADYTFKYI